jgi:predicted nucleotidyltransferase
LSGLPERVKLKIIHVLSQETSVGKAMLYGSRARRDAREGSDIDIALFGDDIPLYLNTRLRDAAGLYKLDIVRFDELDQLELKENILRDGIEIYRKS